MCYHFAVGGVMSFNVTISSSVARLQPVVTADKDRVNASTSKTPTRNIDSGGTRATFSPESLKLASKAIDVSKPETVRNFLSNFDFQKISPKDLAYVGGTLAEAGVIDYENAVPLIGTELTYEKPLDPNKAIDSFKIFDDTLAANIAAGPNAGRDYHLRAVDFIHRLATFATSDREKI